MLAGPFTYPQEQPSFNPHCSGNPDQSFVPSGPPSRTASTRRNTFIAQPPSPTYQYAKPEKLIKVTMMLHRHPALTAEQFHRYWSTYHGPLVSKVLLRHGVVNYTQYHIPQPLATLTEDSDEAPTPTCPTTAHPDKETQFPSVAQMDRLTDLSTLARQLSDARGLQIKTYDAYVEFTARDTVTIEKVFTDMEYLERVRPDESVFFDKSRGEVVVGWVEEHIKDGFMMHNAWK